MLHMPRDVHAYHELAMPISYNVYTVVFVWRFFYRFCFLFYTRHFPYIFSIKCANHVQSICSSRTQESDGLPVNSL